MDIKGIEAEQSGAVVAVSQKVVLVVAVECVKVVGAVTGCTRLELVVTVNS